MNFESSQFKYGPIANVHDQGMTHMLTATGAGQGTGGRGARQPLPRRIGGRPVDRPAHRGGDRRPDAAAVAGARRREHRHVPGDAGHAHVLRPRRRERSVQAGDSDPARGRSGADLRAADGQHAGRDDRTDPGGAAEPAVGAGLRQERLRRSDGPARQRRPRQAGSAPDQRPRHRDARRPLDLEPDLGELPRHHDAASDAAAAAGVPARPGPARSRGDRDAGHELLRHQLPRDRPDADGPDDPGAAVRSDAGGEPAVVDRREHGDPRVAAAGVPRHARAPHDDAQRERRRVDGRRTWSIRRRR